MIFFPRRDPKRKRTILKMQIKFEFYLQKIIPQSLKLTGSVSPSFSRLLIYVCVKTLAELLPRKAS